MVCIWNREKASSPESGLNLETAGQIGARLSLNSLINDTTLKHLQD
jgi:hypothetical protein